MNAPVLGRAVAIAIAGLVLSSSGCRRHRFARRSHASSAPLVHVPRLPQGTTLELDGELEETPWQGSGRSGAFKIGGVDAHPYSDARFLWGDGTLYLGLYAADEDIHATLKEADAPLWIEDAFHVEIGGAAIDVNPLGTITDSRGKPPDFKWQSGAKAGVDMDGTPNDPSDDDEEWVVEMALPLASIGVEPKAGSIIPVTIRRCDKPKKAARVCADTTVRLVLD